MATSDVTSAKTLKLRLVPPLAAKPDTNPVKVAAYAELLKQESLTAEVRGVLVFEDRGNGIQVSQVGSCSPPSSRMMIGMLRWLIRSLM